MAEEKANETTSSIKISDDAIAAIAGLAATDVEGVASMAGNLTNELIAKLGVRNLSKGVKISLGDNSVDIDLTLLVEYGCNIPKVCETVQAKVKEQVENMTDLTVSNVSIHITGVEMKDDNKVKK